MNMERIITQMLVLFIMMLCGYAANRKGLLDAAFNKRLSSLILTIGVPAMILASVKEGSPFQDPSQLCYVIAVFAAVNITAPFLAEAGKRLLLVKEDENMYRFMFALSNAGFMGLPVIQSIFGDTALVYAALFLLPNNFLMYIYGVRLFQKNYRLTLKAILNPPVIASLLACLLCLLDIQQPLVISETAQYLGGFTTPLAMMIIGSSLADVSLKEICGDFRLLPFTLLKLLGLPILYYFLIKPWIDDQLLIQVSVMMMAMPVATNTVIFASAYGGNVALGSRSVFVTSTLSVLTIPLLCLLLF